MSVEQLLKKIDELPLEKQREVYAHIAAKLKKKERALAILESIRGRMPSSEIDAQDYINELRGNDRF